MVTLYVLFILSQFLVGFALGWLRGHAKRQELEEKEKLDLYCAGWRDSIYNILGEYNENYYFKERAVDGFKEFQSAGKKPEPH